MRRKKRGDGRGWHSFDNLVFFLCISGKIIKTTIKHHQQPPYPLYLPPSAHGSKELACGGQELKSTPLFDPSMSALPIIARQNSHSVGLFTRQQGTWAGFRPSWDRLVLSYRGRKSCCGRILRKYERNPQKKHMGGRLPGWVRPLVSASLFGGKKNGWESLNRNEVCERRHKNNGWSACLEWENRFSV